VAGACCPAQLRTNHTVDPVMSNANTININFRAMVLIP